MSFERWPRLLLIAALGCSGAPSDYLGEASERRAILEAALWRPELPYSQSLLLNYGLEDAGWELLSALPFETEAFTLNDAEGLARGEPLTLEPGAEPVLAEGVLSPGEVAFFQLPMRSDPYLSWFVTKPELFSQAGLQANEQGRVVGLIKFRREDGVIDVGMSCAFCHAGAEDGAAGRANRNVDVGLIRARYLEALLADGEVFLGWGPGRVDVTDDGEDNPTAIPDLWGVKDASYLNHSGVILLGEDRASTMAVRFETQFILGHRVARRPPRAQMWALAQYVLSLSPPPGSAAETPEGRAVFEANCARCHGVNGRGLEGRSQDALIPAEMLTSDPAVARSPKRGTGFYKVPSLVRAVDNAPYLHDGSMPSLQDLLMDGHPHGVVLPKADRAVLIDFLRTL